MALAFIAFFGLVTAALLQLADTVELQQSHGQSAANANAAAEGGMFFAAEAAAQQGSCDAKATIGPITMMGSDDSASVTTNACNPGATADLLADQCAVCVLGPYGPSQSPSLSVSGTLTVQGPIAVSGDATSGTTTIGAADTQSTVGGSGFIGCSGTCSGDYLPSNTATLTQPPSATAEPPTLNCQTFQPPLVFTSPTPIAGCYSSLSLDCSGTGGVACTYPLAGLVEVDGLLTIGTAAGPETTVSNPSSSYAALALVPVPRSAGSGGSLLINADGALDLQGLAVTGDVALYVDPSDHVGPLDALRSWGRLALGLGDGVCADCQCQCVRRSGSWNWHSQRGTGRSRPRLGAAHRRQLDHRPAGGARGRHGQRRTTTSRVLLGVQRQRDRHGRCSNGVWAGDGRE